MYKFFLATALLISASCFSQDSINSHAIHPQDSVVSVNSYYDSMQKLEAQKMAERSINYILELQRQRNAQQKKKAMIYIALGVFFLAVMIVGLLRRRRKK